MTKVEQALLCGIMGPGTQLVHVNNYIVRSYRFVDVVTGSVTRRNIKA